MPTILTKKSDTPGSIPATANLTNAAGGAELAVNTADKRLFTINSTSQVVELGTNPSSITCADGSFTVARIGSGTVTQLTSTSATITTLTATSATVTNLTATSLVISNLSVASMNITTLTSASATITNLVNTSASITTLTNNPTFGAGTANGVLYLNGSKVATSGSGLTFDGTTLVSNAASARIQVSPSTNTNNSLFQATNGGGSGYIGLDSSTGSLSGAIYALTLWHNSNRPIVFGVNNAEQMRLNTTGLGIGTSSPARRLSVLGANAIETLASFTSQGTDANAQIDLTPTGVAWGIVNASTTALAFSVAGSVKALINTSGNMGIGTSSPALKLDVAFSSAGDGIRSYNTLSTGFADVRIGNNTNNNLAYLRVAGSANGGIAQDCLVIGTGGGFPIKIAPQNAVTATFDVAGNLGLGVTPSAWNSSYKAFDLGSGALMGRASNTDTYLLSNAYFGASTFQYKYTAAASYYLQANGLHAWYTAPSGTAGNAITFTQAMTLDASGNLSIASGKVFYLSGSGGNAYLQESSGTLFLGAGGAGRVQVTSGGNVGIGTTPSSWSSDFKAIEFAGGNSFYSQGTQASLGSNAYNNAGWKYAGTGTAGLFTNVGGAFTWYNAASGTAGNAISWSQPMTLDASGNLQLGATSGSGNRLNVVGTGGIRVNEDGASTKVITIRSDFAGVDPSVMVTSNHALLFGTNNAERARITSGGYSKFSNDGTYYGPTGSYHEFISTSSGENILRLDNEGSPSPYGIEINFSGASPDNNTQWFLRCADSTTTRCYIWSDGDLANHDGVYGTISDERLKQDIVDAPSQWDDLKAVRFRKYRMKSDVAADPNAPSMLGVVAQELEQVCPGLVEEHPDMEMVEVTDEEGNVTQTQQPTGTTTKTVKSSILLMKAAVALQEAMARIEQLEAKVAALETK